jgi:hypothetical protein
LNALKIVSEERQTDFTDSRRQSADLARQLDQPFEHEETLLAATNRQQEIIAAMDITKNQASAAVAKLAEEVMEKVDDTNQRKRSGLLKSVSARP